MNELFAGYANYASTQAVLTESLTAGNSPESDPQSSVSLSITLTVTVTWSWSWTF